MTSIIDKSLDEIIKDEKKAKRKEMLLKKKKQQQQQQGKGNKKQQGNANRRQGNAGKGAAPARRGQGRPTQNQRQPGNSSIIKSKQGANRQRRGNQQTGGRPKVLANKLKNRQALNNAGKQMLNRVKKAQGKQGNQNRQNQQIRRKDARQNILDRRRGLKTSSEVQGIRGGNNPTQNRNRQILSNQPSRQGQNKRQQRPNQRNRRQQNAGHINELRVSFANTNIRQPPPNRVQQPKKKFNINRASFAIAKTATTLNDRFSGRKVSF